MAGRNAGPIGSSRNTGPVGAAIRAGASRAIGAPNSNPSGSAQRDAAMDTTTVRPPPSRWLPIGMGSAMPEHTGIYRMHMEAHLASLEMVDLMEAVKLPEGVDLNAWLASALLMIYEEASQMASLLDEICTDESCPIMCAGKHVTYKWADESRPGPVELSAPKYIRTLLDHTFVRYQDLVPKEGRQFPDDFPEQVGKLMKRIFRIYAHAYICHFEPIRRHKAEAHVNGYFKHFLFFVMEFRLVNMEEMLPLKDLIQEVIKRHEEKYPPRNNNRRGSSGTAQQLQQQR